VKKYNDIKEIFFINKKENYNEEQLSPVNFDKIPSSTYRVQFNKLFRFRDAINIIPYLKELGITHLYSSPLLLANQGSMHGYDTIDYSCINPEIGSREDFNELVSVLKSNNMGLILDIVPNHMGIGNNNKWWMDVLENGQASEYADFFDIDWTPIKRELNGKVLIATLGDHYGNVLANGEFAFKFEEDKGKLKLNYYEHEFPINPSSYPMILEHRLDVLEARLGSSSDDYLEYLSISTMFKNIPDINETDPKKIVERSREKQIAYKRLSDLCNKSLIILNFIKENLQDFTCKPEDELSCKRLHQLLEEQAYRLAYWRVSTDIINYRRFFDVNSLIGLRTENSTVFTHTHSFIFDLIEEKKLDGLRIDHPDGLLMPSVYFKNLQQEAARRLNMNFDNNIQKILGSEHLPFYITAEKILAPFEKIPHQWAIHGTVGYEFLNISGGVFVDSQNEKKITKLYHKYINKIQDFDELVIKCKKLIMKTSLTSELGTLANYLSRISEKYYSTRDYTFNNLRSALTEVISCFPVYRTYIADNETDKLSRGYIKWAVGMAKKRSKSTDPSIYDFIQKILLGEFESDPNSQNAKEILKFILKFQQYTGPLMAKGLEDTVFYSFNRLVSLNEVGGTPEIFGISVNDFHNFNINKQQNTPYGMLATSTHDTKRSEDVRARISVLSEIPDEWQRKIVRWSQINKSRKTKYENMLIPEKNDEYLFYQTLIGIWPEFSPLKNEIKHLSDRIINYMIKAVREAKLHTSWINVNTDYENAITSFIKRVLNSPENHPFWKEFLPFQKEIASRGYINSLAQTTLKLTCPGVPDFYQGSELWKLNLVDPDNRNPIDFQYHKEFFKDVKDQVFNDTRFDISRLMPIESGKIKMFLIAKILNFRKNNSLIFKKGNYIPIEVKGEYSDNIIAFARQYEGQAILTVVPRLFYKLTNIESPLPLGEKTWQNTRIILPEEFQDKTIKNIIVNEDIKTLGEKLKVKDILNKFPVGILYFNRS